MKYLSFVAFFVSAILALVSCTTKVDSQDRTDYNKLLEKAAAKNQEQQWDSAFYYYNKASEFAADSNAKVYALLQMTFLQQQIGDFYGSEETAVLAYKNAQSSLYLPYIYNTLGIAFIEQNKYDEALEYYHKALNDSIAELDKCIVKNNIMVLYLEKKEFKNAIAIGESILEKDALVEDKKNYAKVLDNIGYAYFKSNNPKALALLNHSKKLRDSLNDDFEKIATYVHLAEYYQQSNPVKALEYATVAYHAAKKVNSPDDKLESLKLMIEVSQPTAAKNLAIRHIELSDSIFSKRQFAKNQFAKIKYDASKAHQDKVKSEKQKQIILWILIAVAVIAVSSILFIRYRNKQKLKATVYDTELRISKKIHDELANDVFQAMTFAETQDLQNTSKKEALLDSLDNIYARTRDISQSNSQITTNTDFKEEFFELLNNFNSASTNVILKTDENIAWDKLKKETKITLYRVMQELMVNMKKHSNCTIVIITFTNHPKQLEIKYADNGQGINPETFDKKGLQNVENRIHAIKGTIIFDNETHKGFKVNISIPK